MYKVGNSIETTEEYGSKKLIICKIDGTNLIAQTSNGKKKYNLNASQIKVVLQEIAQIPEAIQINTKLYCKQQAERFPDEKSYWEFLGQLNPGDKIKLCHRQFVYDAEFVKINQERPLYPFQAKIKDKVHNFKLRAIILHT